ncbi:cuticle protein 18.7-like [Chelonus insularis]|uniref:cuticle protein 18.7-like n=1 Tax=Chelonus insularis TaxID=460826 RepID=UPI001588A713|nr:cuticle protein 18.7-like [Chelonus insularis]
MKSFIALCAFLAVASANPGYLLGYHLGAPLGHDGRVVDTPEVAQAKAAHLATLAKEAARNTYGHGYGYYAPALSYAAYPHVEHIYAPVATHHGPPAPLAADGRVIDTPEVAHAKAEHLAAHAKEAAKTGGIPYGALAYSYAPVYTYAYGWPHGGSAPLGPDGRVVDTPEVAHAKAAHLAAHHAATVHSHH